MKVFVDTNVWLSGLFSRGLCAELLEALIESEVEILLDERVIGEFRRIAHEKFKVDVETLTRAEIFFQHYAHLLPAADSTREGIPDPDDGWIIAAALAAGANAFVTGDKALLALGQVEQMPIISPRLAYLRLRGMS